jgi:penicillin-binding protein 2
LRNKDYQSRQYIIIALFILGGLVILFRVFSLQFDDAYSAKAEKNAKKRVILHPMRGSIYDRNGELLVGNQRSFDLVVTPRFVKNLDTNLLATYTNTNIETLKKNLNRARRYSSMLESVVVKNIEKENGLKLLEKIHSFPGINLRERTTRYYPHPIGSNVLGYISRIPQRILKKDKYYHKNDDIGMTGVEKTYEKELRGEKGYKYFLRDKYNRIQDSYKAGEFDKDPKVGSDLDITIDWELQEYAQQLMNGKKGAVVAIEPASGEVLSIVSSPSYDPNLLVGRKRSKNYSVLEGDTLLPLFDRALTGQYPPGSTFKLVNALIGLQEGVLTPYTKFPCNHGWRYSPRLKVGCHSHYSPLDLRNSIAQSCNAYYCYTFQKLVDGKNQTRLDYKKWVNYVKSFGLGGYLNNDFHVGKKGFVPSAEYNDKRYPTLWKAPTVISLSIGQDALLVTPIQMANMCAAIANRGFFYTPHIIKKIGGEPIDIPNFTTPKKIDIDKKHFEVVIDGMQKAIEGKPGVVTATNAKVEGITICGKTGTAENIHGKDHSIFIAFAPRKDPKIAIAVYVENAGWGSSYGSPIASLMIEKYLNDTITRTDLEKRMINTNLLDNAKEK